MDKITLVLGCISNTFDFNDKSINDLSFRELKDVFEKCVNYITSLKKSDQTKDTICQLILTITESFGEFEDLRQCECCGDEIWKHTLTI